nr:LuxR C-terminal-related transcriptional regulator [Nocardioides caldifontis]
MSTAEAVRWALTADRAVADDPLDGTRLTRREREIALLIGEGLTNQQIADRLVISVRTAQGHVEKILRKLELASRTQVATWVVSRRA